MMAKYVKWNTKIGESKIKDITLGKKLIFAFLLFALLPIVIAMAVSSYINVLSMKQNVIDSNLAVAR